MLPEELLHTVARLLEYDTDYRDFRERASTELRYRWATQSIRTLSLVNRQLRRISLPFLFQYVKVKYISGLENFRDQCNLNPYFAASIKTLDITGIWIDGQAILHQLLPSLTRLAWLDLHSFETGIDLLTAIHDQPNITTIVTTSPHRLSLDMSPNISKVVLCSTEINCLHYDELESRLSRGMQLMRLYIRHRPHLFKEEFGSHRFPGLREMRVVMGPLPVVLTWLPKFTSSHPHLRKITFDDKKEIFFKDNLTLPFTVHFTEEIRQRQLNDAFSLWQLVISRSAGGDWQVTGLKVMIEHSLCSVLTLLYSSFPTLSVLNLEFKRGETHHIDQIIPILQKFTSLRVVELRHSFERLHFGRKQPWKRLRATVEPARKTPPAIMAEAGLLWYTSRIARATPTIEAFYFYEEGFHGCDYWTAEGWLIPQEGTRATAAQLIDDTCPDNYQVRLQSGY